MYPLQWQSVRRFHPLPFIFYLLLSCLHIALSKKYVFSKIDVRSPLYLRLPDCRDDRAFTRLHKETKKRGVVCSIFKNEGGFLSEFVTYYQMHGIDHIRLYDRGSVDNGLAEVEPWRQTGFISFETNIGEAGEDISRQSKQLKSEKIFFDKKCKKWAQEQGYDFHFSVDISEYLLPREEKVTIMDAMDRHVLSFDQAVVDVPIYHFQASPHTLEPISLLTVEAYQLRMGQENQLTYFKNVSSKVALQINHPLYQDAQRDYMTHCCNSFGCGLTKKKRCRDLMVSGVAPALHGIQQPEDTTREFPSPLVIFRYARSLEKFELQYSVNKDSSSDSPAQGQNVGLYMDQSVGVEHDGRAATRYGCQMRELLKNVTGDPVYLRPGPYWYRNVVHGKELSDGRKGKRSGKPIKAGKKVWIDDPYEYHGFYKSEINDNTI